MLCYKDMTFCSYLECAKKDCHRRLTEEVEKAAKKSGLLICSWSEKPDCFESEE